MTTGGLRGRRGVQRRTVAVLAVATILGGLGSGAAFSAGSLLIVEVTGSTALSGLSSTMVAVGAALAGIPLARFAVVRGRRIALSAGNLIAALGAVIIIWSSVAEMGGVLIAGFAVLGVASAVQLQSRFAAADLALPEHRARDLSLVVWSITVGAVTGPNLIGLGSGVEAWLGIPELSGVFVFTFGAQVLSAVLVLLGLRPDPLLEARRLRERAGENIPLARAGSAHDPHVIGEGAGSGTPAQPLGHGEPKMQGVVIAIIALAHAVMVGLMAMTPVHLVEHGGSFSLVGITISLHVAGMYALSPLAGYATGRFGAVPVIVVGFALLGLSALGTATGGASVVIIQTSLVLLGLGWCAVTVAGAVLLTEITPLAQRAKRQGQSDSIMNAAGAAFGAVSGVIFAYGGFPILSLVAGVAVGIGVFCITRLTPVRGHYASRTHVDSRDSG